MIATIPDVLRPIAAVGISTSDLAAQEDGWTALIDLVIRHGLTGLLAEAWRNGQVELEPSALVQVEGQLRAEAHLAVRLEAEILRLSSLLEQSRAVVLKGAGLAHGAYPNPSWRPFTDLDVLVPIGNAAVVLDRLSDLGYSRPMADPSRNFFARVGKATVVVHPAGLVVDLHRTLAAGRLGDRIDIEELLGDRVVVLAGDVSIPVPSWPAHLIEVALHAGIGDGLARAISLRDVVQVAAHPDADPSAVMAMAERWGVAGAVATTLSVAHDALDVAVPEQFEGWSSADPSQQRLLQPAPQAMRSARLRLDELRVGSIRRRSTLMRSLIAPKPDFLRWRYGSGRLWALYWRRWNDLARRRRQGRTVGESSRHSGTNRPGRADGMGAGPPPTGEAPTIARPIPKPPTSHPDRIER